MSDKSAPVLLVTGGTGSIGQAVVAQARAEGWRVVAHGRTHGDFTGDLFLPGAAQTLVQAIGARHGRIDAVVDCVSGGSGSVTGPFADTDPEAYSGLLDASAAYVQRLAHATLPWLARQGGTFIAFASDAGRFAAPGQSLIAASRAAIMAFIRNFALDAAHVGVRANCISPGFVAGTASAARLSEHSRARFDKAASRAGLGLPTPEDIAPLALFLCGEGARRITAR